VNLDFTWLLPVPEVYESNSVLIWALWDEAVRAFDVDLVLT
jgi:hypothetical protein